MDCVVISEGASSARLYLTEIRKRGYTPIVVYPPRGGDMKDDRFLQEFIKTVGSDAIILHADDYSYEDLVKKLKEYSVKAVVAGAEYGVRYADRLARDLSVNGNNPDTTYMRCTKKGMFEGLKKRGIRCIATATVTCDEDIDRFWDENDIDVAFMKYNEGASSTNNRVCYSRQEAKDHYNKIAGDVNLFGNKVEVLIQEYIRGTEYVVNTVSCRGHHIVTDVWDYLMADNGDSNIIYRWASVIDTSSPELTALKEYALKVVDALGFEYGPCHGEYFIDRKGPVLIETNARPMGGCMEADYLDECIGHHITDIAIETYLNPEKYVENVPENYVKPKKSAKLVFPYSLVDADVELGKHFGGIRDLKTYRAVVPFDILSVKTHVKKTTDLSTSVMVIKLCGKEKDVENDIESIYEMEKKFNSSLRSE